MHDKDMNPDNTPFLSTPSGWRATCFFLPPEFFFILFLSTPSGWRATGLPAFYGVPTYTFLSTPSGWRATKKRLEIYGL